MRILQDAMELPVTSTFQALTLSPQLTQVVAELGYSSPTAIQIKAIPLLLQGKDLIGQSQTGSGKTAAFTLPILETIRLKPRRIQALVLCPTRELCAQVAREIRKLARRHAGLNVLILSGGTPIGPQFTSLHRGVHLVVGTPGRVMDHLRRRSLDLSGVTTLVLDEADRMLEMGFQEDIEQIVASTPPERQTVLFSATFPPTIEALSAHYQRDPIRVTVESQTKNVSSIRQLVYQAEMPERLNALLWIIEQNQPESVIVFCNFKATVAGLAAELIRAGVSAGALHGDLEQNDRDRIMAKFRNRSLKILVATDVAARGIDVADLDLVVNYELPSQPEIYVHRIGRTGRAGKTGLAISFYGVREETKVNNTEDYKGLKLEREALPRREVLAAAQAIQATRSGIMKAAVMRTLYIGGGRKDKVRPGDILGALTGEAGGLDATDVGKIEIHDLFSYVAVSASVAATALERLQNGRIKGRKFRVEPVR